MTNPADILIRILGDSKSIVKEVDNSKKSITSLVKETDKAKGAFSAFGNVMQGVFQGIGQALFSAVGTGIRAAVGEIGKATRAASDLSETMSKVSTVFGDSSTEIFKWSKTSATAFGLSQQAALENTSTLGNMFLQMGEGADQAAGMSALMVELSADIASFHNVTGGAVEVLGDIQSAFRGEYDPIQKYIPLINAASVEQQALAETGKATAKELTALEKAIAVQTLVMQGAGVAAGDFERTINGVANQERILAAQVENTRATLGQAFTPIYGEILRGLNLLIGQVTPYGDGIVRALAEGMVNGIIYLLPVIAQIRDIFTYWLRPQSPPRVLPDLAKWGRDTIEVYLKSMTTADFGILRQLGGSIEGILRSFASTGQIGETDLVGRIFGSTAAIAKAVDDFRRLGRVSADSMDAIRRAAGPAGDSVASLVDSYFDLQSAANRAADAQTRLDEVTRQYDSRLSPLQDKLDDLQNRQQKIRDNQELTELGEVINDPTQDVGTRQLARLRSEEIRLRQRMSLIEDERDTAVDAERQKLEAIQKEEKAAQERFDQQQSQLDQQIKNNSLVAEEISLRERLASEALAEQKRLLSELEAEQRKAEAADKTRLAGLERIYQATLNYNLATADTEGKLALTRLELGRYTVGSAEYFDTLTKIAGLEEQLKKEREAAAKGGAGAGLLPELLPPVQAGEVEGWVKDLQKKLGDAIDANFGEKKDFGISIKEGSSLFNRIIGPEPEKVGEVSADVKNFVDNIKALTTSIGDLKTPLDTLVTIFKVLLPEATTDANTALDGSVSGAKKKIETEWGPLWELYYNAQVNATKDAGKDSKTATDQSSADFTLYLGILDSLFRGDWQGAWDQYVGIQKIALDRSLESTRERFQWLRDLFPSGESEPADPTSPLTGMSSAGEAILNHMLSGLKSAWEPISTWWSERMAWIVDQIPTLPSWLGGGSLVPSFDSGSYNSGGSFGSSSAVANATSFAPTAGISSNSTTTTNLGGVHLVFQGPVSQETIRTAVRTADDELRARGFK